MFHMVKNDVITYNELGWDGENDTPTIKHEDIIATRTEGEFFFEKPYEKAFFSFLESVPGNKEKLLEIVAYNDKEEFEKGISNWEEALESGEWEEGDEAEYLLDYNHWVFTELFFRHLSAETGTNVLMFYVGYDETDGDAYYIVDNSDLFNKPRAELVKFLLVSKK